MNSFVYESSFPRSERKVRGSGPWDFEPDLLEWRYRQERYDGQKPVELDCLVVRGPVGALCGYVGVPSGHPAFGFRERELQDHLQAYDLLSYASLAEPIEHGISRKSKPLFERTWWIGFDCAHAQDFSPGMDNGCMSMSNYRGIGFARHFTEQLAVQLADVERLKQLLEGK